MAVKRKRTTTKPSKVKTRKPVKRVTSSRGYHEEHIAMLYRLGGAGIVIVAGTVIVFLLKSISNL